MKLKIVFAFAFFLGCLFSFAQTPGQWTWMSGSYVPGYPGNFGTMGIPSSSNLPPGLYEVSEWKDNAGNFWLYGGLSSAGFMGDMWKFDIVTHQWTWMNGSGQGGGLPVYGTKGIPAPANTPGYRCTSPAWTDSQGNFWLYGGIGGIPSGGTSFSDLWKYDPLTNLWVWMKGDSSITGQVYYGTKGVEDPLVQPPAISECAITWNGNTDEFWMLDNGGCLWRYRISTNNWTWMSGIPTGSPQPVYGQLGIADTANTPGFAYFDFTHWKDSNGDFWYLSGGSAALTVLWKYSVSLGAWTWMSGDTAYTGYTNYGPNYCDIEKEVAPYPREETRACWVDGCDNLWMLGGYCFSSSNALTTNDLVYYSISKNAWVRAGNDTVIAANSYGTQGVAAPTNHPGSRSGASAFTDQAGNLWLFGGINANFNYSYGDLWMYTPDSSCTGCHSLSAIHEQNAANDFQLAVNFSEGQTTVHSNRVIDVLCVYDAQGRLIYRADPRTLNISFPVTSPGVYLLTVVSGDKTAAQKFVVPR